MDNCYAAETQATPQTSANAAQPEGGGWGSILPIIVLWVVVMYFFIMRPNKRKEQERKQMLEAVAKGDHVVTIGGLHGTVAKIEDDTITLKVDDKTGACLTFTRQAVAVINNKKNAQAEEPKA